MRRSAAVLVLLLASTAPRVAKAVDLPVRVEGPRTVIRAQEGMDQVAEALSRSAEEHLVSIESDLAGLPRIDRVEVRLVKGTEDLPAAAPPGYRVPEWAAGTAFPKEGVVAVAARTRKGTILDFDATLAHELAHMALARALAKGHVPRWLNEGFAYLHSSDFSWGRTSTLMGAVMGGRLIPLSRLDAAFPAREDEAHLAYAQSYDFVSYLSTRGRFQDDLDDGSRAAFQQFLAEIGHGVSVDEAARSAFGRPLLMLEAEWAETLRTRFLWIPVGLVGSFIWVLGALLLVLGWRRRKRQARATLRRWELEEGPPTWP